MRSRGVLGTIRVVNRVKGETERDVIACGYRSTTIARPSLLLGDRAEHRTGERIAAHFAWLMPPKYKPIEARDVAKAMVRRAKEDAAGVKVVESRELRTIAERRRLAG